MSLRALVVAAGLCLVAPAAAGASTIVTVAGVGPGAEGFSGDGGPATAARLSFPDGVDVAADGSVLIADELNHRVRRVGPDGTITTVAGTGVEGFSGDGGPAVRARLSAPSGVAVAPDGTILIADTDNGRIRRVSTDGTIATVAGTGGFLGALGDGGPAVAAELEAPEDVSVTPGGGYLVVDSDTNRVRRVSAEGVITTVAGTGAAGFSGDGGPAVAAALEAPLGVAAMPDGGFLIADTDNNRVRRVAPDGTITTVAGTGENGSTGDCRPATSAALRFPASVAVTADGGFLIVDGIAHRVRRVSAAGTISTVAGTVEGGFSGDGGPATAARLHAPADVAVTADGGFVIADQDNGRIRRVLPPDGRPNASLGFRTRVPSGPVYPVAVCPDRDVVARATLGLGPGLAGRLRLPRALAVVARRLPGQRPSPVRLRFSRRVEAVLERRRSTAVTLTVVLRTPEGLTRVLRHRVTVTGRGRPPMR